MFVEEYLDTCGRDRPLLTSSRATGRLKHDIGMHVTFFIAVCFCLSVWQMSDLNPRRTFFPLVNHATARRLSWDVSSLRAPYHLDHSTVRVSAGSAHRKFRTIWSPPFRLLRTSTIPVSPITQLPSMTVAHTVTWSFGCAYARTLRTSHASSRSSTDLLRWERSILREGDGSVCED